MTDQEINIAIAESLGAKWTKVADSEFGANWQLGFTYKDRQNGINWLSAGAPWAVQFIVADKPDNSGSLHLARDVPDYFNDLNAMHEAEKILEPKRISDLNRPDLLALYFGILDTICFVNFGGRTRATASQRAEAFLKTLEKWKD